MKSFPLGRFGRLLIPLFGCLTACLSRPIPIDTLLQALPEAAPVSLLYGVDDPSLDTRVACHTITEEVRLLLPPKSRPPRITVTPLSDYRYTVTLSDGKQTFRREITRTPQRKTAFTVASYNIYGCNRHKKAHPHAKPLTMAEYSRKTEAAGVDIVGLQEFFYTTDGSDSHLHQLIREEGYPHAYGDAGICRDGRYVAGAVIASKYPIAVADGGIYRANGTGENRGWSRAEFVIDGKRVALYNTHILYAAGNTWRDPNHPGNRNRLYAADKKAEIDELLQRVWEDPTPYKIITGDFNTDQSKEETEPMRLCFHDSNGWKGQWNYTCYMDSSMLTPWVDHILTTTNIEIVRVRIIDGSPSDHHLTCAELRLHENPFCPQSTQLLDNFIEQATECIGNGVDAIGYTPTRQAAIQAAIERAKEASARLSKEAASPNAAAEVRAESNRLKKLLSIPRHADADPARHTVTPYFGQAYCQPDPFGHTGFRTFYYCQSCHRYFYYDDRGNERELPTRKMANDDDDALHFPERFLTIPLAPHLRSPGSGRCARCGQPFLEEPGVD